MTGKRKLNLKLKSAYWRIELIETFFFEQGSGRYAVLFEDVSEQDFQPTGWVFK